MAAACACSRRSITRSQGFIPRRAFTSKSMTVRGAKHMAGQTIKIHSRSGGAFDCWLSMPAGDGKVPAIVLASAVHGVDKDIRDLADEFASHGYIAAAPGRKGTRLNSSHIPLY